MFKSKKGSNSQFSKLGLSPLESVSRNIDDSNEDLYLSEESKKSKKKNLFNAIRCKISSVLEGKNKDSTKCCNKGRALRSKSFEVLSNSFEESESVEREDSCIDRNKWGSKRSQSIRSKHAVCPTESRPGVGITSNTCLSKFHQNSVGIDGFLDTSTTVINDVGNLASKSGNYVNDPTISQPLINEEQNLVLVKEDESTKGENKNQPSHLPNSSKPKEVATITLKELGIESSPYLGVEGECRSLAKEIRELSKHGWYWGPLNRNEAEDKLSNQPDGAFLVRDSSDVKYVLSLSFRSYGKTLHTRIEHSNGWYSFYPQPDHDSHRSLVGLINHCISESDGGVFCYSRPLIKGSPSFPVRLTKPVSRFMHVRSLQHLCRFVIRQYTSINHIQNLPLPPKIKGYLEERYY